jgi:PIN domain nuclease of toxin-antitoxin system
MFILA